MRTTGPTNTTQTKLPPIALVWLLPFAAALILSIPSAHAQTEHKGPAASIVLAASLPPYDVVSVKQNIAGDGSYSSTGIGDGAFTASNVPLKRILELVYDVREDQIFGLTGPVSSARFDIVAKVIPPNGGPQSKLNGMQLAAMLIPALADRFHFAAHLESKTLPVYELVVARGGPKLQPSKVEGTGGGIGSGWKGTNRSINSTNRSMIELAAALSDQVHREVIDKTGLTVRADFTLKWSDDVAAQQGGSDVVSIFTALEEQLGLKLQPSKAPVDTLVIDHAEMPSQN